MPAPERREQIPAGSGIRSYRYQSLSPETNGRTGRVLYMGAGTGRPSIMVLEALPQAILVAVELLSASYEERFGLGGSPQRRYCSQDLKAVGVEQCTTIQCGFASRIIELRNLSGCAEVPGGDPGWVMFRLSESLSLLLARSSRGWGQLDLGELDSH